MATLDDIQQFLTRTGKPVPPTTVERVPLRGPKVEDTIFSPLLSAIHELLTGAEGKKIAKEEQLRRMKQNKMYTGPTMKGIGLNDKINDLLSGRSQNVIGEGPVSAVANLLSGDLDPSIINSAAVNPIGTVYHGTRSEFKFFDPKKFRRKSQPQTRDWIHASVSPTAATKVAREDRDIYNASINVIPIKTHPTDELLNVNDIKYKDLERLNAAMGNRYEAAVRRYKSVMLKASDDTAIEAAKDDLDRISSLRDFILRASQPISMQYAAKTGKLGSNSLFAVMDPRVIKRAGFKGVQYKDIDQKYPAIMFPAFEKLTTPWGTPLTKQANTALLRSIGQK